MPLETAALPHEWASDPGSAPAKSDLVPLQLDLLKEGLYPPAGKSLHECPISGMFGPCAKSALSAFQKKYGIDGESGVLGNRTRVALDLAAARTN